MLYGALITAASLRGVVPLHVALPLAMPFQVRRSLVVVPALRTLRLHLACTLPRTCCRRLLRACCCRCLPNIKDGDARRRCFRWALLRQYLAGGASVAAAAQLRLTRIGGFAPSGGIRLGDGSATAMWAGVVKRQRRQKW
jgi:hypothetical protein